MKKFIFLSFFMTCAVSQAQIYSYVDQNGNTIYTDTVPEQQKDSARKLEIELTPSTPKPPVTANNAVASDINTNSTEPESQIEEGVKTLKLSPETPLLNAESNALAPSDIANNAPKTSSSTEYTSLKIKSPTQEETFTNTGGQITIKVASKPNLTEGAFYRFLIDNNVISETTNDTLKIGNIDRGEHQLEVQIVSDTDEVLLTDQVTFFIRQTTLADKRRMRPCMLDQYGIRPECPLKDKPKIEPRNLLLRTTDALGITARPVE